MRVLIDACVLYPTVMREMVIGAARGGFCEVRWSQRILDEWHHAAARLGPEGDAIAAGEIAALGAAFPTAMVAADPGLEQRLWLPDADDVHVLAAAIKGSCDAVLTLNNKDFPGNLLADEGLFRSNPDELLCRFFDEKAGSVSAIAEAILAEANRLSPNPWTIRALMKKARLPRLGKRLAAA